MLDDIGGRLAAIRNLPDGAGPIHYQRDFGDTATLMLTVASPKASGAEVDVRAAEDPRGHRSDASRARGIAGIEPRWSSAFRRARTTG